MLKEAMGKFKRDCVPACFYFQMERLAESMKVEKSYVQDFANKAMSSRGQNVRNNIVAL